MTKYYDRAWNPVFGCQGNFKGCENCFARTLAEKRNHRFDFNQIKLNYKQLKSPFNKKDVIINVCSQSDLFQNEIYFKTIDGILRKCNKYHEKKFMILTKYSHNMFKYFSNPDLIEILTNHHFREFSFDNFYFGVSVCSKEDISRIKDLNDAPVIQHRFIAFEPLLEDVADMITDDMLDNIEYVILGAETGPGNRPCNTEWLVKIMQKIQGKKIKVYVNSITLEDGNTSEDINEMPEILRRHDLID